MSGYTPLFQSLTTGTLCGKWPDIGLWPIILSLSNKHGVVDVTPQYLAGVTGLSVDEVSACMERFCAPDPYSRSSEHGGARLILLEPNVRKWGWIIVNHSKYREKARLQSKDADRTASGRDAERKRIERSPLVPRCPPASPGVPLSDADADTGKKLAKGSRIPDDFTPDVTYAQQQIPDIDAQAEAEGFRDYWQASSSPTAVKRDWKAAWRTWIRNCRSSGRYARKTVSGGIHAGVVMR